MGIKPATIVVNARKGSWDEDTQALVTSSRSNKPLHAKVEVEVEAVGKVGALSNGSLLGKNSIAELEATEKIIGTIEKSLSKLITNPTVIKIKVDSSEFDSFLKTSSGRTVTVNVSGSASAVSGGNAGGGRSSGGGRGRTIDPERQALKERELEIRRRRVEQRERSLDITSQRLDNRARSTTRQTEREVAKGFTPLEKLNYSARQKLDSQSVRDREAEERKQRDLDKLNYSANQRRAQQDDQEAVSQVKTNNLNYSARQKIKKQAESQAQQDRRVRRASEEFEASSNFNEFTAYAGGLFTGGFAGADRARATQRLKNAEKFVDDKNIKGLDASKLASGKSPGVLNFKNLKDPAVAAQIGFGGIFGGAIGLGATALGGLTGGLTGAIAAGALQQTIQGTVIDPLLHAFEEHKQEFTEAGRAYSQSILGVQSSLQATTQVVGAGGGGRAGLGAALAFQEKQATDIQLAARKRLLPIGISGDKEATFVQGLQNSISSRGITTSAKGLSEIAGLLGSDVVTQRRSLLDNSNLLLRDVSDLFSGGSLTNRTIISQLGGVRGALTGIKNATSEDDIIKSLRRAGSGSYEDSLLNSTNVAATLQRFEGAQDQVKTVAGAEYLETIKAPLANFAKTLGAGETEDTFKNIGKVLGEVSAVGINFANSMQKLGNSVNASTQPLQAFTSGLLKLGGFLTGSAPEDSGAGDKQAASITQLGISGAKVANAQRVQSLLSQGGLGDSVNSYYDDIKKNPAVLLSSLSRAAVSFGDADEYQAQLPGILSAKLGLQEDELKQRSSIFDNGGFASLALQRGSINERLGTANELLNRTFTDATAPPEEGGNKKLQALQKKFVAQQRAAKSVRKGIIDARDTTDDDGEFTGVHSAIAGGLQSVAKFALNAFGGTGLQAGKGLLGSLGFNVDERLGLNADTRLLDSDARTALETQGIDKAGDLSKEAFSTKQAIKAEIEKNVLGSAGVDQQVAASAEAERKILELRKEGAQVAEKESALVRQRFDTLGNIFSGSGGAGNALAGIVGLQGGRQNLIQLGRQEDAQQAIIGSAQELLLRNGSLPGNKNRDNFNQDLKGRIAESEDKITEIQIQKAATRRQQIGSLFQGISSIGETAGENASIFSGTTFAGQRASNNSRIAALAQENIELKKFATADLPTLGPDDKPISGIEKQTILQKQREAANQFNANLGEIGRRKSSNSEIGFDQSIASDQRSLLVSKNAQIISEEIQKRQSLTQELESSKSSLANFNTNLRASTASKGEQIANTAKQIRDLGGSVPSELNFSEDQLQRIRLNSLSSQLDAQLVEAGLSETGIDQGLSFFNPRSGSALDLQSKRDRQNLLNNQTNAGFGLGRLGTETSLSLAQNGRDISLLDKKFGAAEIPGFLKLPDVGTDLFAQKELSRYVPNADKLNEIINSGQEGGNTEADIKQLAQTLKTMEAQLAVLTGTSTAAAESAISIKNNTESISKKLSDKVKVDITL